MEGKGKKAARRTADVIWDKGTVSSRKTLKTDCTSYLALFGAIHLVPTDCTGGCEARPGFCEIDGAIAIPEGVSFTMYSHGAIAMELLLLRRTKEEPYAVLPLPKHYRIGSVHSMIVFKLSIGDFEHAYRVDGPYEPEKGPMFGKNKYLLGPYVKAVTGQSRRGDPLPGRQHYKARVVKDDLDQTDTAQSLTPMKDLIIYEPHVRGFTIHGSSAVLHPGTFDGLVEKLPYLLELGVNVAELMPIFEFDEMQSYREMGGRRPCNYWGYNTISFFASDVSYTVSTKYNREGSKLKNLIWVFSQHGIEVYLDVVFNHTAEGNESGPSFSFRGFDNNTCYLLTPKGYYHNFSNCGNTLNCNHPIVQQVILNYLRYWVMAYRIDGFCFDPAPIMTCNEDDAPIGKPPLFQSLTFNSILGDVKLMAEAQGADGLYQMGTPPSWNRWTEWNDRYKDSVRRHIKEDQGMAQVTALRIVGPRDTYADHDRKNASVNFITCHNGFTLYDLLSHNIKHNESNEQNNMDGANGNNSWSYGAEGETDGPRVEALGWRMVRNACVLPMCNRGIPMSLAGDEFYNAQLGNNNTYCQDNEISWLSWERPGQHKDMSYFFQYMIRFRETR